MPAEVILADLRITHSVEMTIENIIEERVAAPPVSTRGHKIYLSFGPVTSICV